MWVRAKVDVRSSCLPLRISFYEVLPHSMISELSLMKFKNKFSRKSFPVVVGLSIGVSIALLVNHFFFNNPSYDEELKRAAKEITKSCPVMVDEQTRLDRVDGPGDNRIMYFYTLVKLNRSEVDAEAMKASLTPVLVEDVVTNAQMAINREHHTTMVYSYSDRNGEFLFSIEVTPEIYKNHHH